MSITRTEVHSAIDTAAAAAFLNKYPGIFGNQKDLSLSSGTVSYFRERVHFPESNQFELGSPGRSRTEGVVVFTLYVRKGAGDGDRNLMSDIIAQAFRSKQFGGATFLGMRELPYQETENWCLTGVQIPFHFDEV